jgi:Domain of unknown function (DUF4105)
MEPSTKEFRLGRVLRLLVAELVWVMIAGGVIWAFGALWFDFPHPWLRKVVAGLFVLAVILVTVLIRPLWRAKIIIALATLTVMAWWLTLQPRQFRDWKPEVSTTAHAEVAGDIVTIHNVRNFDYRTDKDFTPRYETRRLDLRNLRGVDIFINYWGSPYMAHPIMSFDFGPDGRVCFSIETRPEKNESYSALGGLYRRFELIYLVADERDVIRLRTNYRKGEDTYLYRLKAKDARPAFMEYIHTINELHRTPRWYNAITNNCTSAIRNQRAASERAPWDWRMLVNGFGDELLYERGAIDNSLPFAELKRISHINPRAHAADDDPEFSQKIRAGLPGMEE